MQKLRIQGGRALRGEVPVGGSKNAALPALAATLLTDDRVRLENVPMVGDVDTICRLLQHLGIELERPTDGVVLTRTDRLQSSEAPYELVKTMRASFLVLGPLLARTGSARVSLPGGCAIGARPVDRHLSALRRLGADLRVHHGYVEAACSRLRGAEITFEVPTVGGTENLMMAATLADGTTFLHNAAREPEIIDLAVLLAKMGADIEGAGTDTIVIRGVDSLHGTTHAVIPDRIEAGTFIVAGALIGELLEVVDCRPAHLGALLEKLHEAGIDLDIETNVVRVRRGEPRAADIRTQAFPGFPTDMQAQYMVLMTQASGSALVRETIFENRFMHVPELSRMGADIALDSYGALVRGPTPLSGATLMATDLRASASLVLAGLVADSETVIDRVYHLDRGYENLVQKLSAAGAVVERFRE